MKTTRIHARIKPGRFLVIPPIVCKRFQLAPGDQVDVRVIATGRIEMTKALTPTAQRIRRFRERVRAGGQRGGLASKLAAMPNVGVDDDFSRD